MADKSDEEFFKERGFGLRIGYGNKPALIIIDIINAFSNPDMPLGAPLDDQIKAIGPLLDTAHERDIPVFFSTVAYEYGDLRDAGLWGLKMKGTETLMAGTPNVEVDSRLEVRPADTLLKKKYASCFFGTDLGSQLSARNIDTLIVTGCTTSGCVRATAVDAVQSGFRPIVVRQAVGDRSKAAHDQSLFDLDAKYADVVEAEDALSYLKTIGDNSI
ncbi:MAG: isochorismatase family protein [Rhodospirillales bacterium]|nr:isochorismatase family protein [Rhodospirillales bacterium]